MTLPASTPISNDCPAQPTFDTREAWTARGFYAPAAGLFAVFLLVPIVSILVLALTDWQLGGRSFNFVGVDNFIAIFSDPVFRKSLMNTILYIVMVVPITIGLALTLAILIERRSVLKTFYRAAHFLPVMATMAAMAVSWQLIFHPLIGFLNIVVGWFGVAPQSWLRDSALVLPTLATVGIWQQTGFALVLFIAGLRAIPSDLYEAAELDGAEHALDRLMTVTWPLLGPVTMFVFIVTATRALEVFDTVHIMTEGGPNKASEVLLHTIYMESFVFFRTGYGAAVTVVFLLLATGIAVFQIGYFERRVHYR